MLQKIMLILKEDQRNNKKNADTNKNIGNKNNEKKNATKNSGNSEKNSKSINKISDKKDTEKNLNMGKGNNNKNSDKSNVTTKMLIVSMTRNPQTLIRTLGKKTTKKASIKAMLTKMKQIQQNITKTSIR